MTPGEESSLPDAQQTWSWLLDLLERWGTVRHAKDGEVRYEARDGYQVRFDVTAADWHDFVVAPHVRAARAGSEVEPLSRLPLWVEDEMFELLGTRGPHLVLSDGRIVDGP